MTQRGLISRAAVQLFISNAWLTWTLLFGLSLAALMDEWAIGTTTSLMSYLGVITTLTVFLLTSSGALLASAASYPTLDRYNADLVAFLDQTKAARGAQETQKLLSGTINKSTADVNATVVAKQYHCNKAVTMSLLVYSVFTCIQALNLFVHVVWFYNAVYNSSGVSGYINAGFDTGIPATYTVEQKVKLLSCIHQALLIATGLKLVKWAVGKANPPTAIANLERLQDQGDRTFLTWLLYVCTCGRRGGGSAQ